MVRTIAFINSTINKEYINSKYEIMRCGEANGYVAVPPEHPLYGKDCDDIDGIDVHGGLSASGHLKEDYMRDTEFISDTKEVPSDWWVFGFDTMHCNDSRFNWPKERVKEETLRLQEQLEKNMFSKEQKVEIVTLNYKAALKDLQQVYEAGFVRPIEFNMAVNRLIYNTMYTISCI